MTPLLFAVVAPRIVSDLRCAGRWWPEVEIGMADLILQFVRFFILLDAMIPIR